MQKSDCFNFPELETDRIRIRPLTAEDAAVIYSFNSCKDSLKYIVREPYASMEEAVNKLENMYSAMQKKEAYWWVFELKGTGEKIGYGGLFDISKEHNRSEIGYGLLKKFWNQGYMSEIISQLLRFGFETVQFHKIYAVVLPGNRASIKLLEHHQFEQEALLKEHSFARGQYFDEIIFGRLSKLDI